MKEVKVGIVSDTHGAIDTRILQTLHHCDFIVHAGDIMAGSVLQALRAITPNVIAVAGNNELAKRWPQDDGDGLDSLPEQSHIVLPGGVLAVEHGHRHGFQVPNHESLRAAHPSAKAIVYGHTHKQVVDQATQPWVLNPGAAGHTRNHGGPCCLILLAATQSWRVESIRFVVKAA